MAITAGTTNAQDGQHLPRVVVVTDPAPALLKPETRRLYAADWAAFALWCRNGNQTALQAIATTLTAYLQDQAARLGAGALARRLAAIIDQHQRHGLRAPARGGIFQRSNDDLETTRAASRPRSLQSNRGS